MGFIVGCSYVSFVCILCFYPVALCIVVFCCFPLLAVGDILSASAYFWAVFNVRLCSSTFIWGVVLILLRFCPHVVSRLCPCFLYWGFIPIFYTEALSSYFILRLCRHILYWGFVLIVLYWGYVPQFEALVLIVVGPCYFVSTTSLVCLQWYVCGSVCLYFCLGEPDANIVWF